MSKESKPAIKFVRIRTTIILATAGIILSSLLFVMAALLVIRSTAFDWAGLSVITLCTALIVLAVIIRRRLKISEIFYINRNREVFHTLAGTFQAQSAIVSSTLCAMGCMKEMEKDEDLAKHYNEIKATIEGLKDFLSEVTALDNDLQDGKRPARFSFIEHQIFDANNKFHAMADNIDDLTNRFSESYLKNRNVIDSKTRSMARMIYYLGSSAPIMADLSQIFNEFSKNIVLDVIQKFGYISEASHTITTDIQSTMQSLMDDNNPESLAFITRKAHSIVLDFEKFMHSMENLKVSSNNFIHNSVEKLKNIQGIAASIEDISQTIKIISLNVSIEAANTGATGKGFQVLARDLREFASRTMRFAQDVKNRVKDTLETTENLRSDYARSMQNVYTYIDDIKNSILGFEAIITKSFGKIRDIIGNLQKFSESIDNGIKEIVGKLQYYDITSQEVEHLAVFVERIFVELFNTNNDVRVSETLTEEERREIRTKLLSIVNEIITTGSERKVYEKYVELYKIGEIVDIEIENRANKELKQGKEDVFLF